MAAVLPKEALCPAVRPRTLSRQGSAVLSLRRPTKPGPGMTRPIYRAGASSETPVYHTNHSLPEVLTPRQVGSQLGRYI